MTASPIHAPPSGLLAQLRRTDTLRAFDLAFADTLHRLDPATDERVLAGAALASLAVGLGHAAFDPARPQLLLRDIGALPDAQVWREALLESPWVSQPRQDEIADPARPLVFENGLLYLRRYREYERALAANLRAIAQRTTDDDSDALKPLFELLFPLAHDGDQARAAQLALREPLALITGGPGTGKTTTIARLLLLLLANAQREGRAAPRIALAAPTGRAAERMSASLRHALEGLRGIAGIDAALLDALPRDASTLHRLLGAIPDRPQFRHHAGHPLPFDAVVVDEASMVDLPLMAKLVDAVPAGARLVLLGDPDQLPSVEAGDVLAAMDQAADADASPLAGLRAHLRRSHRQVPGFDLAPLAQAVREGDANAVLALLHAGTASGVQHHLDLADPLRGGTRDALLAPWRDLAAATDARSALGLANRQRLLTPLRDGPQGTHALNARIEEALGGAQRAPYFHGRLLQVTENSYRHGLFNGDIGVCLRDDEGAVAVWFADGGGDVRGFHPAALPAHDSAFAMTVHKSQGSEFDQVWLLLPRVRAGDDSSLRMLSRELLYTAITRARSGLHVCASDESLHAAVRSHVTRVSGLRARLASSALRD
ncbi:MAG: exodeoxyribonuclease V subunit alpha [Luteimonas sp.]